MNPAADIHAVHRGWDSASNVHVHKADWGFVIGCRGLPELNIQRCLA